MLVIVMMEKARDPKMYTWMGFDRAGKATRNPVIPDAPTDNRVPIRGDRGEREPVPSLVGLHQEGSDAFLLGVEHSDDDTVYLRLAGRLASTWDRTR